MDLEDNMIELNAQPGEDQSLGFYLRGLQYRILAEFPDEQVVGVEMGVAYGGGVEALGILWKGRGIVYGFDTFEGHPKQLGSGPNDHETNCMDDHYAKYGTAGLSWQYQMKNLLDQGIENVTLVRGLIDHNSCWRIPKIHYCLLDMDILKSMQDGYEAVRHRIVDGGYLCLHDVIGHSLLPDLHVWYEEIKKHPQWEVVDEQSGDHMLLAVLRRKR
jgi:hypothetical protein